MKIFYLTVILQKNTLYRINVRLVLVLSYYLVNNKICLKQMSHLYKLQIGLETIIKTKYFVAFIIATICYIK